MQQGPHQFDLAAVAARELTHQAAQLVAQAGGGAAGGDAFGGQAAGQAMQIGMEAQVALDAQVEIERHRLEHHADVA